MMTVETWIEIVKLRMPDVESVESGPVQEPPRATGCFVRVWQSGYSAFYDDGLAEIEWTIAVYRSARGRQDLGPVYEELWRDVTRLTQGIDRTAYSITQLRAEVGELPVDGYVSVDVSAIEGVEDATAWP